MRLPYPVRRLGIRVLRRARLPVLGGPNRGLWWSLASAGRGYLSGRFQPERVDALLRLIRRGDTVWDVGAHKGYVTLATARRVGTGGRVLAIEPSERNLRSLRDHVRWNGLDRITVLRVALSDRDGTDRIGGRGSSVVFRLGEGDERVRVRRAESLLEEGAPHPRVIKIDVEGEEAAVLRGLPASARDLGAALLVAVHDRPLYRECREILEERGYEIRLSEPLRRNLRRPGEWHEDPDLVACPREDEKLRERVEEIPYFAGPPGSA